MRIVRIKSGLGNQMFQYAFFKSLSSTFEDVKLDLDYIKNMKDHNGYELSNIFQIKEIRASKEEILKFSDEKQDILSKVRRKVIGRKKTHCVQKKFNFNEKYFEVDNVLLDGYWQSEKYFKNIEAIIREEFKFKNQLDELNLKTLDKIINSNSISMHIRRGDYMSLQYIEKFGKICNVNYYKKSIEYIKDIYPDCTFFVFSDDIQWAKDNFKGYEFKFISNNTGGKSYIDMQLMSNCKHNIIANSSFSWWAAWLNNNKDKIVIAPKLWFNDDNDYSDVVPEDWIRI